MTVVADSIEIDIGPQRLKGLLGVPADATGLVIFAHGSGSGRLSPRNNRVAAALREAGLATLLLDLLTAEEELDRANVFDIPLLASRLSFATDWAIAAGETAHLPVGYFGASTGAVPDDGLLPLLPTTGRTRQSSLPCRAAGCRSGSRWRRRSPPRSMSCWCARSARRVTRSWGSARSSTATTPSSC